MNGRRRRSRRQDRKPKVRVRWVRTPIQAPRGRTLRVLVYTRYSSDEQRRRSIKAQQEFCGKFLEALEVTNADIAAISDEGMSGELRSRPGIDRVWAGIRDREWNLMLVEDCSRFYRDEVACLDLVRLAVDKGLRTICINDYVDTCEPDWEERLKEAARHHASSNRYRSERIKRAHDELWDVGAALGPLKPGYLRVPTLPATETEPAEGPFFDEVHPRWSPIVHDAFERIAAKEPPWSVAERLTAVGLPRTNGCEGPWSDKEVIRMIRSTIYRGFETYRNFVSKKEYSTGKRKPKPNAPEEILAREMPRLRITDDCLWFAANKAIDARDRSQVHPSGADNRLAGIPRDSRGPLSRVFACSICAKEKRKKTKMHVDGRIEGGYRCGNVRKGACWSKATARRDFTHEAIGQAIIRQLRAFDSEIDVLLSHVGRLADDDGKRETRRLQLRKEKVRLESALANLCDAIEKGEGALDSLVRRSKEREDKLAVVEAELEALDQRDKAVVVPARTDIEQRIAELVPRLEQMDRTVRDELECLVGRIWAVPYQQFDSDKVVLRARFQLRLWALLPPQTRALLIGLYDERIADEFDLVPMQVDLFKPSTGPRCGLRAVELETQHGWGPTRIGQKLRITKRKACIALEYGRKMRAAGITDPFIELTEPPKAASRWRTHLRHQQNRQQDEGAGGSVC